MTQSSPRANAAVRLAYLDMLIDTVRTFIPEQGRTPLFEEAQDTALLALRRIREDEHVRLSQIPPEPVTAEWDPADHAYVQAVEANSLPVSD